MEIYDNCNVNLIYWSGIIYGYGIYMRNLYEIGENLYKLGFIIVEILKMVGE